MKVSLGNKSFGKQFQIFLALKSLASGYPNHAFNLE